MKKLLLLFVTLFVISLVSAGCSSCTQSGFSNCYECSDSYEDLTSSAKIYFNMEDDKGDMWGNYPYAIGNLYINVGTFGSGDGASQVINDGYVFYNKQSWSSIWGLVSCSYNGCSTTGFKFTEGKNKLASKGESFTNCIQAVSITHAKNDDWWMWTSAGSGWLGTSSCMDIKVVECSKDSDCNGGLVCDKSGDWKTWKCIDDVECRDNFDCPAQIITEKYCSGNDFKQKITQNTCESNACIMKQTEDSVIETCPYQCGAVNGIYQCIEQPPLQCTEGVKECSGNDLLMCQNNEKVLFKTCTNGCNVDKCIGGNSWIIYVAIGAVVLVVGFLFIKSRKKKK